MASSTLMGFTGKRLTFTTFCSSPSPAFSSLGGWLTIISFSSLALSFFYFLMSLVLYFSTCLSSFSSTMSMGLCAASPVSSPRRM